MKETIKNNFKTTIELLEKIHSDENHTDSIKNAAKTIIESYNSGKKLLIAGNGGSAADAQHIAGELVNKFYKNRKALSAISLTTDTTVLTSWANDKHFDNVFERQIEAHGREGDVFLAITTSGNSKNLIHAVKKANELGMQTIGLLGNKGGEIKEFCKHTIIVPHTDTARIQEAHHVIYHTICELVEKEFLDDVKIT